VTEFNDSLQNLQYESDETVLGANNATLFLKKCTTDLYTHSLPFKLSKCNAGIKTSGHRLGSTLSEDGQQTLVTIAQLGWRRRQRQWHQCN